MEGAGSAGAAGAGAASAAAGTLAEQLVDAMSDVYGRHAGYRAAHAKGTLCAATFLADPGAAALSSAAHFAGGGAVRAHVRFSNGSGNPTAPDSERDGRGMAIKFYPEGEGTTDIVALTLPQFFTRTPEELLEFNRLRRPSGRGPDPSQPDLEKLGPFLGAHPETVAAIQGALGLAPAESYLRCEYNGIHSFLFVAADGSSRYGRYKIVPELGVGSLSDEDAAARAPDYLQTDVAERLGAGPAGFSLELVLAGEGDAVDDPTQPWPAEERERVVLGRLELTGIATDRERDGDVLVFDPTRVCPGIEMSDDPVLRIRGEAYSVSVARRVGA